MSPHRTRKGLLPATTVSALGGIRTPNLLIRSQMLYPLSYERRSAGRSLYRTGGAGQLGPTAAVRTSSPVGTTRWNEAETETQTAKQETGRSTDPMTTARDIMT